MDAREALAYMGGIQEKLGSSYSLRSVRELAGRVGHPERTLGIIHIAGTNGKGSVGNYISNILSVSGYTVGRYVSPAVFGYREKIQRIACGTCTYFSEEEMAEMVTLLKGHCENMVLEGFDHPTAFEIETVMAFLLFHKWKVDAAIVECGLGGRLDATNIITNPLLVVFTSISRDHMKLLGDSVPDIAREKYGIIKEKVAVVSKRQAECEMILQEICGRKKAELVFVEGESIGEKAFRAGRTSFAYKGVEYAIRQGGVFQIENAAIAIESARMLRKKGFVNISEETVREGVLNSHWRGRFDLISQEPFLLVDGAHNEAAARALCDSLKAYFPDEKFSFVMGVFRDKEYGKMLSLLLPLAKNIYTVSAPGPRGLAGSELCQCAGRMGRVPVSGCGRVDEALRKALAENAGGKIIACGSLSILKDVYVFVKNNYSLAEGTGDLYGHWKEGICV